MNGDETQMPFRIYYTRSVAPVPLPITHLYPRALSPGIYSRRRGTAACVRVTHGRCHRDLSQVCSAWRLRKKGKTAGCGPASDSCWALTACRAATLLAHSPVESRPGTLSTSAAWSCRAFLWCLQRLPSTCQSPNPLQNSSAHRPLSLTPFRFGAPLPSAFQPCTVSVEPPGGSCSRFIALSPLASAHPAFTSGDLVLHPQPLLDAKG